MGYLLAGGHACLSGLVDQVGLFHSELPQRVDRVLHAIETFLKG